jgi:hypothetical protein
MLISVACTQCGTIIEREKNRIKKSGVVLCSAECNSKYCRERKRTEFTIINAIFHKIKGSAKRKNLLFDLTKWFLKWLWEKQGGFCNLSGIPIKIAETTYGQKHGESTASLDRIDSSKGYVEDNVQFLHKRINDIKRHLPEDTYIYVCRCVAEHTKDRVIDEAAALDSLNGLWYARAVTQGDDPEFVPF